MDIESQDISERHLSKNFESFFLKSFPVHYFHENNKTWKNEKEINRILSIGQCKVLSLPTFFVKLNKDYVADNCFHRSPTVQNGIRC